MPIIKNRPITGREYKIMLKTDKFKEREQGISDFKEIIKKSIELINSKGKLKPIYFERIQITIITQMSVWYGI